MRPPGSGDGIALRDILFEFLKLGVVVFGSGYVLFAFLHAGHRGPRPRSTV